mgnify:CR=1 FL=1
MIIRSLFWGEVEFGGRMKLYVGVTDNEWYRFLSRLPNVDEVNFWQVTVSGLTDRKVKNVIDTGDR